MGLQAWAGARIPRLPYVTGWSCLSHCLSLSGRDQESCEWWRPKRPPSLPLSHPPELLGRGRRAPLTPTTLSACNSLSSSNGKSCFFIVVILCYLIEAIISMMGGRNSVLRGSNSGAATLPPELCVRAALKELAHGAYSN